VSSDVKTRLLVWDLPTRVTHWLLVVLVPVSWWSAENNELQWHRLSGYTILSLVLFRIAWGFVGSATARFANFVRGPRDVMKYASQHMFDRAHVSMGHNPLGGWSVVAILAVLMLQLVTGLFAVDVDGIESGPLSYLVTFDTGRALAKLHHQTFDVMTLLIVLHIVAVAYYAIFKRQALVSAMVGGFKHVNGNPAAKLAFASTLRAVIVLVLASALVAFVAAGLRL